MRQVTLGQLIGQLRAMTPDALITDLANPHSYRGHYDQLAFERQPHVKRADEVLSIVESALDQVFKGYKGGSYRMTRDTPVWIAEYGHTGVECLGYYARSAYELKTRCDNNEDGLS